MKKFLLSSGALLCLLFASCENEVIENISQENDVTLNQISHEAGSWSTVFEDNFNTGSNINNKWTRTTGRTDYNSSICHYKSWFSTLGNLDGKQCLKIAAKKINNSEYRAGHVKSKFTYKPNNNEEYRLRASIKLLAKSGSNFKGFGETYGAWPAFWTVQENAWPTKGEIDIMEGYSYAPQPASFASNLFYGSSTGNNQLGNSAHHSYGVSEGWHTYEMRWKKKNNYVTVQIYLDGVKKKTYNNTIHSKLKMQNFGPHNIILNLNVGSDTGIFDNSKINLFSNTFMYVDYVKLDKRTI